MPRYLTLAVTAVILSGTASAVRPVSAHHGWTGYDETRTVTLTGTIREAGYENPHGFVRLQVDGGTGKTWHVILAPPSRMQSRGLEKAMLSIGTTATAAGYVHRSVADELRAERITISGKATELR